MRLLLRASVTSASTLTLKLDSKHLVEKEKDKIIHGEEFE